jgi:hypothetical protein
MLSSQEIAVSNPQQVMGDRESERIAAFQEQLSRGVDVVAHDPTFYMEHEDPAADAANRFATYELSSRPTLYLRPRFMTALERGDVTFMPKVSRVGKKSAHGLFFGDISSDENRVKVAVKPHVEESLTSCLNDDYRNELAKRMGFHTLRSVGVLIDSDRTAYSMTLRDDISSLESIDWSSFFPDITDHPGMLSIWSQVARQAAALHEPGNRSHGDLAARNIATSLDDSVFFFDWEHAQLGTLPPRDEEVRFSHSFRDMNSLLMSMCLPTDRPHNAGIGVFTGKAGDWWSGFCRLVLDEYEEQRMAQADRGDHHSRQLSEVESELTELRRSLHAQCDQAKAILATS